MITTSIPAWFDMIFAPPEGVQIAPPAEFQITFNQVIKPPGDLPLTGQPSSETGEVKFIEPTAQNEKKQDSEIAEKPALVVPVVAPGFFVQAPVQFTPQQIAKPLVQPMLPVLQPVVQTAPLGPVQVTMMGAQVPVLADSDPVTEVEATGGRGQQPLLATTTGTDPVLGYPVKPLDPQRDEWIEEVPAPGGNQTVPPPNSDVVTTSGDTASDSNSEISATTVTDGPTKQVEVDQSEDRPAEDTEAKPRNEAAPPPPAKDGPQKIQENPDTEQRRNPDIPLPSLDGSRNDSQVRTSIRTHVEPQEAVVEVKTEPKVEVTSNAIQAEAEAAVKSEVSTTKVDQVKATAEPLLEKKEEVKVEFKSEINSEPVEGSQVLESKVRTEVKEAEVRERPVSLPREQVREVIRQVEDRIEFLAAARPKKGVTIHLEPRELGTITLNIVQRGSEVEAKVDASLPSVREALAESRQEVTKAMESRGLQLSVSVGSDPQGSWEQSKPQQNQRAQGVAAREEQALPDESQTRATRRAGRDVDLWI
ncbi:MAG TPA: flagellar hook-length control protein FliK [Fimbriimonadaceae bacterium]|nr:flagellar hook-length control protein FliK [Fimbriimonadaceae bacterium]